MTVHLRVRALFVSLALGGALFAALPAVTASAAPSFSPRAAAPVGVHVAPARTAAAADGTGLSWLMLPSQRTLVVDVVDKTGDAWPGDGPRALRLCSLVPGWCPVRRRSGGLLWAHRLERSDHRGGWTDVHLHQPGADPAQ